MSEIKPFQSFVTSFHPLSQEVWNEFQQIFTPLTLHKNEYFIKAGQNESRVGILLSGLTRTFYVNQEGKEFNKYFSLPFSFVASYASYVTQKPSLTNIQALKETHFFIATLDDLNHLAAKHHSIETMIRKLAEFLVVKKEKREYELVMLDAEARYEIFKRDFPGLENEIAQYHIASYLGITPTQLSRVRGKK